MAIEFNLTKILKQIQADESRLKEFLEILSGSYRYSLNQVLVLYTQGYRGKQNLCGYEFLSKRGISVEKCEKYTCILNGGNSVNLFGVPKLDDFDLRFPMNRERKFNSYNINRFNRLVQKVRTAEAVEVKDEAGLDGYRLDGFNLFMDIGNTDKITENTKNVIRAVIEKRSQSYKSLFCREVVEALWFKGELNSYDRIKQLSGKDFHDLLDAAFEEYKKLYYTYEKNYFTIDEIVILNMCFECKTTEDIIMTIRNISGVKQEFLVKIRGLNRRSVERILRDVREGRLTHFPEYSF